MKAFGMLIDLVGYTIARLTLPLLSLGWVYVEPFSAWPKRLSWPGYRRDETGRVEVQQAAAGAIGLALCLIVLLAIVVLVRAFP
jgi:hypothetical protein